MAVKTRPSNHEAVIVPRGKKDGPGRTPIGKQVNVRIPDALMADLELVAADTNLDISAVIRLILTQNTDRYVREARERQAKKQEGE